MTDIPKYTETKEFQNPDDNSGSKYPGYTNLDIVEHLTNESRDVLEILERDCFEPYTEEVIAEPDANGYRGYPQTLTKHRVMKTQRFLVGERRGSVMNLLRRERDAAVRDSNIQKNINDNLGTEVAKLKTSLEASRESYENLVTIKNGLADGNAEMGRKQRKMEKDLGKLRSHFGKKDVKEALGEKA